MLQSAWGTQSVQHVVKYVCVSRALATVIVAAPGDHQVRCVGGLVCDGHHMLHGLCVHLLFLDSIWRQFADVAHYVAAG
jgi:hypothetical protein